MKRNVEKYLRKAMQHCGDLPDFEDKISITIRLSTPAVSVTDYNNKTIDVIISVAESPTNFYFQILDQNFFDHLKDLKSFNESMDYSYNRKKCQDIREGHKQTGV
jgi:hypothetical protein